jgi:hypothetical protein
MCFEACVHAIPRLKDALTLFALQILRMSPRILSQHPSTSNSFELVSLQVSAMRVGYTFP